jgi:hypothetical protein
VATNGKFVLQLLKRHTLAYICTSHVELSLASLSNFMGFISKYHSNYAENQGLDRDGIQRDHMLILDKRVHTHAPK